MQKKIIFSILIILFLIPALISATTLTVKGKTGYNLTINILNPLNNESVIPSTIAADIVNSGEVNVEFSAGRANANIIVIARVNGKIVKKKELYNVNVQTASPIIVNLIDPPAPKPVPVPTPAPVPAPEPVPTPTPAPAPEPIPETKENKTLLSPLTGMAVSLESINLSPTTKKIVIYSLIGIVVLILLIIIIIIILRIKKGKKKSITSDFKITKLSNFKDTDSNEDIEEAEKRLRVAKDEISRINEILDKRRSIKEAEKRLNEERQALERLKKGLR